MLILLGVTDVSIITLRVLPEYLYGSQINGINHHSLISSLLLLSVSIPAACFSLFYLLGATPRAYDLSRYPIILFPILLALAAYGLIIWKIAAEGAPNLTWDVISSPLSVADDQPGMLNHILGTLLLMVITSVIALPVGVGAGVYASEYGGRMGSASGSQ